MPINNDNIPLLNFINPIFIPYETLMLKVLKSTCKELWRFSACKKSTSSLTSFLRYCKDIADLLFRKLWECLNIPIKSPSINLQETFILTCMQQINFIIHFFLKILQRNSKLVILGMPRHTHLINSSGIEMSLFEKCHHNIVYGKIDFKIPILTPYMREIWDYKNASTESIQRSVSSTDWDFLFWGKSINKKVDILNECLKNIFHNFVPNKVINCDYKQPPWMSESIKSKLKERAKLTKKNVKGGKKDSDLVQINALSNECTKAILEAKKKYISQLSQKPINPSTEPMLYWKIIVL